MWFIPLLSRDLFTPFSLRLSRGVKDYIEDGHMEHSFGREGVWSLRSR